VRHGITTTNIIKGVISESRTRKRVSLHPVFFDDSYTKSRLFTKRKQNDITF